MLGWRSVAAAALLLTLTACQVTVSVGVDARSDGTGTVRAGVGLDAGAAARVGDLSGQLRVDDLRQSGWEVVGPRKESDGRTWVRASKAFSSPEQASEVMGELSGPDGPFRELRLGQRRSFFHTRTSFSGAVDLSRGLSGFLDPDLERRLGGPLGPPDVFTVEVVARLPGSIDANATGEADGGVQWVVEPGQQLRLEAEAEAVNLLPWLPAIGALVAVAVALVVVLWRRRQA